jgi:hypothetical protein
MYGRDSPVHPKREGYSVSVSRGPWLKCGPYFLNAAAD